MSIYSIMIRIGVIFNGICYEMNGIMHDNYDSDRKVIRLAASIVYRGEKYFRDGESFSIIPHAEAAKDGLILHSHDFVEICYVYSGCGYHVIEDQEYRVAKGDLFLINYEMTHGFYRGPDDLELTTYNILFKPGFLDESLLPFNDFSSLTMSYLFKNEWDEDLVSEDLRLNHTDQREFDQLVIKMNREYSDRQDGYNAILRAYMIEFIVMMMRGFHNRSANDPVQPRKASMIEAAIQHLDSHYNETISLVDLARKTFISKNYFCQLFKEITGMTVSQYTQQMRIEEAIKLIRDTDMSMSEIAYEVGYSDYKAFYVIFKKLNGISPNEFKKGLSHKV